MSFSNAPAILACCLTRCWGVVMLNHISQKSLYPLRELADSFLLTDASQNNVLAGRIMWNSASSFFSSHQQASISPTSPQIWQFSRVSLSGRQQ